MALGVCPKKGTLVHFVLDNVFWTLFRSLFCLIRVLPPCFLFISICMKYIFPSPHFQSLCVLCPKVGHLQAAYWRLLFLHPTFHSVSFDWSIFSPLTFKIIIYRSVFFFLFFFFFFCHFNPSFPIHLFGCAGSLSRHVLSFSCGM